MRYRHSSILALAVLACGWLGSPAPAQNSGAPVEVTILAINDFHGHLMPPPGGITIADPADGGRKIPVSAGGSEHMGTLVKGLRAQLHNTVSVGSGALRG